MMDLTSGIRRAAAVAVLLMAGSVPLAGQGGYLMPPSPIPQILDAAPTPSVSVAPGRRTLALLGRANLPPVADLAEPDLKLAGYRINPTTTGPANIRLAFLNGITFQDLASGAEREVRGLPANPRLSYTQWSPDGSRLAFGHFTGSGIELWVADVASGQATRVLPAVLSATWGSPYLWLPDGSGFIVRRVAPGRAAAPERSRVPDG